MIEIGAAGDVENKFMFINIFQSDSSNTYVKYFSLEK